MPEPNITFRANKGQALSYGEMDTNLGSYFYSSSVKNGNILVLHYTGSPDVPVNNADHEVSLTAGFSGGTENFLAVYTGSNSLKTVTGLRVDNDANLGIGVKQADLPLSHKLEVSGSIRASRGVFANSDERLKENIDYIDGSGDILKSIDGFRFNFNGSEERQVGVIAQHVKEVLPEVVSEDKSGYLSVDYSKLTAVLINAVNDLTERVRDLEQRLNNV